ncbi:uncharacterized protein LOC108603633 [Drosophila busckii]|uniref:uncharacterized protein LOC108603633 n=1 Tax=Drosophila busckii TaxID=30019 RepID=UPI00083EC951|nr:uncharacterized protein LOC108603633 [Drosophila busckii]
MIDIFNIMGDSTSKLPPNNCIHVPDLPKLCDNDTYWKWRILLRAYLDAIGLWSGNAPLKCPQSKFIILSTLELWIIDKEYENKDAKAIFEDLERRYTT